MFTVRILPGRFFPWELKDLLYSITFFWGKEKSLNPSVLMSNLKKAFTSYSYTVFRNRGSDEQLLSESLCHFFTFFLPPLSAKGVSPLWQ